jgi:hypothetical protein
MQHLFGKNPSNVLLGKHIGDLKLDESLQEVMFNKYNKYFKNDNHGK